MSLPSEITIVRSLVNYFKTNIPEFTDVLEEFPNPNQDLNYPSLTIDTQGNPEHINQMPTILSKTDNVDDPDKLDVVWIIGQYNLNLQLDIWSEHKSGRGTLLKKVIDVINKGFIENDLPVGISLVLEDYHGGIARYDFVSYNYVDNEQGSQKNEWRAQVKMQVTFPELILKTQPKIIESQINNTITAEEFDDSNEEIKQVF